MSYFNIFIQKKQEIQQKRKRVHTMKISSNKKERADVKITQQKEVISVPKLSSSIQQMDPMKHGIQFLKKTQNENDSHSANIRLVRDRFIKGIEDPQWIKTPQLVLNKEKLGIEVFEKNSIIKYLLN